MTLVPTFATKVASDGLPFRAMDAYSHLVSDAFHPPSGVLFSFPSPYWCAIGLRTYLALEVNGPLLPTPYPRRGTLGHDPIPRRFTPTGPSPSMVRLSSLLRLHRQRGGSAHNPTSLPCFHGRFGLGSSPFTRRY